MWSCTTGKEDQLIMIATWIPNYLRLLEYNNLIDCASLWLTGIIKRVIILGDYCLTISASDSHTNAYVMRWEKSTIRLIY